MHGVMLGWRWMNGEMVYKGTWRMEERRAKMTILAKTTEIMEGVMNSICGWLKLTMENESMFGGVLPTLDLNIWISESNEILYSFFEKAMVSPLVLHKRSAMPEGITLNQELVRRMVNTSESVDITDRVEIVNNYSQKLINSEYTVEEAKNVVIGGLKGYERLLSLSRDITNPRWKPLHMPRTWNQKNRRMAKLKSKSSWFKGKAEIQPPSPEKGLP